MQRTRVKSRFLRAKWRRDNIKPRAVAEQAGALAFIAWRIAHETAMTLHGENYVYRDDNQRLDVIAEFLAFITHIIDRIAYERLPQATRDKLINTMGAKLADHIADNRQDWQGAADHRAPFIELLNRRCNEYAEEGFTPDGPGYGLYRHAGHCVQSHMMESDAHDNRWVIDQVMQVEGPEIYQKIAGAMENLLATGSIDLTPPTELRDDIQIPKPGEGVMGE